VKTLYSVDIMKMARRSPNQSDSYAPAFRRLALQSRAVALAVLISRGFLCDYCLADDPLNTWNVVFSGLPFQISSMAYGNGTFLGVGGGFRLTSYDGANWTVSTTSPIINSGGVAYGNGMFLTFGKNSQYNANYILQSTNATTWTTIYASSNALTAAAYGNDTWVFIGTNDIATATTTSSNWNWVEFQPGFSPSGITYGNGVFVVSGSYGSSLLIVSSSDGITWQLNSGLPVPAGSVFGGIAYGNGVFAACCSYTTPGPSSGTYYNSVVLVSSNLVEWTQGFYYSQLNSRSANPSTVAFGGTQFIANPTFLGHVITSSNAYAWTSINCAAAAFATVTYGQGTFVGQGFLSNNIYQSGVFATQSNAIPATLSISTYPGVTVNGRAGRVYQIQYTTNLNSTWLPLTNFPLPCSPYTWVDTSSPAVGQRLYRSVEVLSP
jgi:hypothetical protein